MEESKKKFNLRQSNEISAVKPEDVPTLIPKENLDIILQGDTDPYYKIQEIPFPVKANGDIYIESFFVSYLSKLNRAPIPGSKSGHETNWGARPETDLYVIGGEVKSNGDGSGVAIFKNYIPPVGDNGKSNEQFIKDNKLNIVDYSLVSYVREEVTEDENGERVWHVIESLKGERNDAVEYACGAMQQKTNAREGDNKEGEGKTVNKEELLKKLNALKTNGDVTLVEIADELGLTNQLVTDKHINALETVIKLNEIIGDDPIKAVSDMKQNLADIDDTAKANKLAEVFGVKAEDNLVYNFAEELTKDKKSNEVDEDFIASIKENAICKALAGKMADGNKQIISDDKREEKWQL